MGILRNSLRPAGVMVLAAGLFASGMAYGQPSVSPFKDDLFSAQTVLKSADSGNYLILDYDEMRDINGRDTIVEKRVQDKYVSLKIRAQQKDLTVQTAAGMVKTYQIGKLTPQTSMIVLYLHGKGGSRHQGVNDFTFGGNFNRLKNLVTQTGGVYLVPDFSDFAAKGTAEIAGLIAVAKQNAPKAKVFVTCGSAGGVLCWQLASDANASTQIDGLALLGSLWDDEFRKSAAFKRKIPVFLSHGSRDPVFAIDSQEAFYRSLRKAKGGYPVVMHRYETGNHGTPIRMTDWRVALNWLASKAP
ncbi:putative esterase [Pseudochrobactrum asaccharolyticum]|uniref:Putative esterase n=2 Tax=Pseudochrobactrum asaccharolyticum TaxID=354351 RepID=A0A366DYN4_9HYPH|nr:alpha/beta hydrolase [Pseudochrobactrum asaccharolyticum]RBO95005.1 putative esterase [Pseudochrobactrum asaccharolyticum]